MGIDCNVMFQSLPFRPAERLPFFPLNNASSSLMGLARRNLVFIYSLVLSIPTTSLSSLLLFFIRRMTAMLLWDTLRNIFHHEILLETMDNTNRLVFKSSIVSTRPHFLKLRRGKRIDRLCLFRYY